MGETTGITWCHSTFNLVWGCIEMSPGCMSCYAKTIAERMGFNVWGPAKTTPRRTFGEAYWRKPLKWNRDSLAHMEAGGEGRRVFCSSMADVFEDHPTVDQEREKLWPLIRETPALTWLLLTKRAERIARCLPSDWGGGYHNVWLGTSVEDQRRANERIPHLLAVPARVHWLSCEPLLERITLSHVAQLLPGGKKVCWRNTLQRREDNAGHADLVRILGPDYPYNRISWVVVGGESGAGYRPMDIAWGRAIKSECDRYGAAFFFKQRSGTKPGLRDCVPNDLLVQQFPVP